MIWKWREPEVAYSGRFKSIAGKEESTCKLAFSRALASNVLASERTGGRARLGRSMNNAANRDKVVPFCCFQFSPSSSLISINNIRNLFSISPRFRIRLSSSSTSTSSLFVTLIQARPPARQFSLFELIDISSLFLHILISFQTQLVAMTRTRGREGGEARRQQIHYPLARICPSFRLVPPLVS